MASKLCDTCNSATAILYCRPDAAFLCLNCDSKIHASNKVASRHARVWLCEVCEQAPAHVSCKADAAALCLTCDRDIHSANPLARRHDRAPVAPFYDSVPSSVKQYTAVNFLDDCYFSDLDPDASREEEEAASWLLPNPKATAENTGQYLFSDSDPYLDLECGLVDPKLEAQEQNSSGSDGVVPVQSSGFQVSLVNENCFDLDLSSAKALPYCFNQSKFNDKGSLSSSCVEVGVVPDGGYMADVSNPYGGGEAVQLTPAEREARVMRYREKRKNRKFEKTIRYASRKAYAEMRPRIKGRFAKRSDVAADAARTPIYSGFGVVPSF